VIAVFIMAILFVIVTVSVGRFRQRAEDVRVVAGVVQFGLLAKAHSKAQNGSYRDFDRCLLGDVSKCQGGIERNLEVLVADVEDAYEGSNLTVKVSADGADYCVGAALGSDDGAEGRCVDSDAANTADQNLICSNSAKCEVVGSAVVVALPNPTPQPTMVPTPVPQVPDYCDADMNTDGVINFGDILLAWWAFLNGDITWADVVQFMGYWLDNRARTDVPYCPVL